MKGLMPYPTIFLILGLIYQSAFSQELVVDWLQNISDRNEIIITDCIFDQDENILLTGNVIGLGLEAIQANNNVRSCAQLIKYDSDGVQLWSKGFTSDHHIEISHIIKSGEGFYLSGLLKGEANFDGKYATSKKKATFIACFDEDAKCNWIKTLDGALRNPALIATAEHHSWMYLSGDFHNEFEIADTVIGKGSFHNVLTAKIDKSNGNIIGYSFFTSTKNLSVADGISLNQGQLVLTGSFEGSLKAGSQNKLSIGQSDCYILKLDTSLYPVSCSAFGGYYDDYISSIEHIDSSIYLCGAFMDEMYLPDGSGVSSNGRFDVFLSKLNNNADFVSTVSFGGTTNDYPNNLACIDSELYISGTSRGFFKADADTEGIPLSETALTFLARLNKENKLASTWYLQGKDFSLGKKLLIDKLGEIIISGSYYNELNALEAERLSVKGTGSFIGKLINCTEKELVKIEIAEKACDHFMLRAEGNMQSYIWNNASRAPEIRVDSSAWYYLKAKDYKNCPSIDSIFVQVGDSSTTYEAEEWVINSNQLVSLFAPDDMESYTWSNGSRDASLVINSDTLTNNNSTISVTVVDSLGCVGKKYFLLSASQNNNKAQNLNTNANQLISQSQIVKIHPNPCHKSINIYFENSGADKVFSLEIINISGDIIWDQYNIDIGVSCLHKVNSENFAPGSYFVRVFNDGFSSILPILIK